MFSELTILELASVLAAPSVGMFFAELGAKVIKIENAQTGGDLTRAWKSPSENPLSATSAYYASVNWNKETHFLDLSQISAQKFIQDLIQTRKVDIVLSNFKPQSAQNMGVAYPQLQALKPDIIYAQLSGYGETDERVAFDVVLQAETGFMYMNGQADSPPTKMPVALIDVLAAHQLKEAILIALYKRLQTGKGALINVSLYESALAALANQATNYLMNGHIPQRTGSLHPNIAPYGEIFRTKDGISIVLAIGTDKQFRSLCDSLGIGGTADNQAFSTNFERVRNRKVLADILQTAFAQIPAQKLLSDAYQNHIPMGQVRNLEQVFEQASAQKMILEQSEPDGSISKRMATVAFQIISNDVMM